MSIVIRAGLVASLDRSGDGFAIANWKENRPPTVHITRVLAAAQRSNGQPEKFQVLIRPPAPWLAYPAPPVGGEAIPVRDPGEPLLVRVDPQMPTVRLEADIAADVAVKYFADGLAFGPPLNSK